MKCRKHKNKLLISNVLDERERLPVKHKFKTSTGTNRYTPSGKRTDRREMNGI